MLTCTHVDDALEHVAEVAADSLHAGLLLAVGEPQVNADAVPPHLGQLHLDVLEALAQDSTRTLHHDSPALDLDLLHYRVCACVSDRHVSWSRQSVRLP